MFNPQERHSKPFHLDPGIRTAKGELLTECVVRLLTRADQKQLAAESEATRDDATLARYVARIGNISDRSALLLAVEQLTIVDEFRIRQKVREFEAEFIAPKEVAEEPALKIVSPTDITSKPFNLNPGVFIDGRWQTTCVVRLLTRGQWKQLQAAGDGIERMDLELYFTVVQFGNVTDVKPEMIDLLTDGDIGRIQDALEALAADYALDTKSDE